MFNNNNLVNNNNSGSRVKATLVGDRPHSGNNRVKKAGEPDLREGAQDSQLLVNFHFGKEQGPRERYREISDLLTFQRLTVLAHGPSDVCVYRADQWG
jgi:hypothetical protein